MSDPLEQCEVQLEVLTDEQFVIEAKRQDDPTMTYIREDVVRAQIEELDAKLAEAVAHLEWFISEDETNRGDDPMPERGNRTWDEINAYWIKHLDSAIAFVAEIKGDRDG